MNIISRLNQQMEKGQTVCLATVIASKNPGIAVGGKVIVLGDGSIEGKLGIAQTEFRLRDLAIGILKEKKSRAIEIEDGVHVFFDVLSSESRLLRSVIWSAL